MRNLLNFFSRNHLWILFILLEVFSVILLQGGNGYHNIKIINGLREATGGLAGVTFNIKNFFRLREENESLSEENAALRNRLEENSWKIHSEIFVYDSLSNAEYIYMNAEVIANSVNKQRNFITLNKGANDSITDGMAVVSNDGVVGMVVSNSANYSIVMPVLNNSFKVSAKIKANGYFGSLSWDGRDIYHAALNEIPLHVPIAIGDTIVTSGYSAIFPEGVLIGTISEVQRTESDFYQIVVRLSVDYQRLRHVYVVKNVGKEEQQELEKPFL